MRDGVAQGLGSLLRRVGTGTLPRQWATRLTFFRQEGSLAQVGPLDNQKAKWVTFDLEVEESRQRMGRNEYTNGLGAGASHSFIRFFIR